ncbi:MAG TPA: BlaI/MecI/CopY family transcriptional regulator [Nitrospirae bacterium]|nr:BlaI/MecI/CopY family transcriptional regulator [Nitrospirota bacterium]
MKSTLSSTRNAGQPLGELELEVMKALWRRSAATGKNVWEEVTTTRKAALTTILTVIDRLCHKGLVGKSKDEGLLIYRPLITKEDYTKQTAGKMLKDYMNLSSSSLVASFVDALDELQDGELEKLSALIEKKKREGRG